MIDPKLNEIAPERTADRGSTAGVATPLTPEEEAERLRRSRAGLSIRDTIAGDSMLSVGARGVDTSGVEAGAGSGSGSTMLTPGASNSPAPEVVPGARSTGTTARATSGVSSGTPDVTGERDAETHGIPQHEIATRAYERWCERGCPHGSPELDWHGALDDLRTRRRSQAEPKTGKTSAASV